MKPTIVFLFVLALSFPGIAQLTIGSGATVKLDNAILATSVNGFVNNSGNRILLSDIVIDGGGDQEVTGEWEITNRLNLKNGIIIPQSGAKLVFSGPGGSDQFTVGSGSFVNGIFYNRGTGRRIFPVGYKEGNSGVSAPLSFENISDASDEIGVRVVNADPQLQLVPDVENILNTRYWEVSSVSPVNSLVSLNLNQLSPPDGTLVVLQAPGTGVIAQNLLGTFSEQTVQSLLPVTMSLLAIGIGKEFNVVVHDLITPFTPDLVNDGLYIENIDLTAEHTVTLLDRWGVVQKEWKSFSNDEPQFDFSSLSPGNYICVVEYVLPGSSTKKKVTQMVTVLRTN